MSKLNMSKSKIIGIAALSAFGIATVVTTSIIAHNSFPSSDMEKYSIVTGTKIKDGNNTYTSNNLTGYQSYSNNGELSWTQNKISINQTCIVSTISCWYSSYDDGYEIHWETTEFVPNNENFKINHTGFVIKLDDGDIYHTWK